MRTLKWLSVLLFSVLLSALMFMMNVSAADMSTGYRPITLDVPYFNQNESIANDCGISSIAMVEAYKKGYSSNDETVYNAVYNHNGKSVYLASYAKLGYSVISNSLSAIYEQLQHDNPVIVYRTGNGKNHFSVIYGYNGSTSTLQKSGFLVLNTMTPDAQYAKRTNLQAWLSEATTWQTTIVRTANNIPLTDKTSGQGVYNEVWASNISKTNAQINAKFPLKKITAAGFYIGKSASSMTKIAEKSNTIGSGVEASHIWFDMNKYYGALTQNTKYYYKIYVTFGGKTYTSNVYSFYTGTESGTGTSTSNVSVKWEADPSNAWTKDTNAKVALKLHITGANLSNISQEGIYLYDHAGNQLASYKNNVSPSDTNTTVYFSYEINKRLNYTLKPGTTYKYKILTVIKGKQYESGVYSFKTTGTHTHYYECTAEKAPSCTEVGTVTEVCTTCGTTRNTNVAATGHSWNNGAVSKEATCTQSGLRTYTCVTCKETKTEPIAATGIHIYGEWAKLDEDRHSRKCTACDQSEAASHRWNSGELTKEPDENTEGETTFTCQDCRATKTQSVPSSHTHAYASDWTHDQDGHWHSCSCGSKEGFSAHVAGPAATEKNAQTCEVCGYELAPVLAHTHVFGEKWVTDQAQHWHECACGAKDTPQDHIWVEGCDANGISIYACDICHDTRVIQENTPADSVDGSESDDVIRDPSEDTVDGSESADVIRDPSEDASDEKENSDADSRSTIGLAIGAVVIALIAAFGVILYMKKRK